jgi:DNA-binding MarR family transcriptional regulator
MNRSPEEFLGYWLFYAQRNVEYVFADFLKATCMEHGKLYAVTPPQWGVLALLWEEDGLAIGSLSQARAIDPPTVTGIVTRLEQSGLVERRHDRQDRRVVKVYLTEEGRDSMSFLPAAVATFNATMTREISDAEQRDLIALLQKIIANLTAARPGVADRFGLLPDSLRLEGREKEER